jgi:hypothetical protein
MTTYGKQAALGGGPGPQTPQHRSAAPCPQIHPHWFLFASSYSIAAVPAGSWLQQQSYRACRELVAAQSYRACRELVAAAEFKPPAESEWKRHISASRAADAKGDGIMRLRGSGGGYIRGWATAPWEPCLFSRID